jgi:D-hexose-6-phosphate mutarotase
METRTRPAKQLEIPGVITFERGGGGLPRIKVETAASRAEIYLHGAQVTGFQKNVESPLLFLSRLSQFAADKPIRGGVPICMPWFGPRAGDVMHGFARITEWEVIETAASPKGGATVRLRLPDTPAKAAWPAFSAEYFVTVTDRLGMELVVANRSDRPFEFENCLHSYFAVGDIRDVSLTGLKSAHYLDKTENGARKLESAGAIRITSETNRVYLDTAHTVEIHDAKFRRKIRVEKSGSASTVVWNPWTTQRMADFGEEEYQQMVCVESGNVGQSQVTLAPGKTARLKVVLSSEAVP